MRALTEDPTWPDIPLTPGQARTLLIHLLEGTTGDDDEVSGLKILNKMAARHSLDDTLEQLHRSHYFDKLFDDYHGSEYTKLLRLLSREAKSRRVKGLMLDNFISMTGGKEEEERAIVVLLERSSLPDQENLLTSRNRDVQLRSAIDEQILYEDSSSSCRR